MSVEQAIIADQHARMEAVRNGKPMPVAESPHPKTGGIPQAVKKGVSVLTPTLGRIPMQWFTSAISLVFPMNWAKGFMPTRDFAGAQIGEMRNRLVQMVLIGEKAMPNMEIPYVFWLDDDVICNPMAIMALMRHDRDIASGVYFTKGDFGEPLMFPGPSGGTMQYNPVADADDPACCVEAYGWAQGLSLIKTDVYKRMRDELDLGVDRFGNPCWYKQPEFQVDPNTGVPITGGTEDFWFFENASKLGYRPLIDQSKFSFGFHVDLATLVGYPEKQWDQYNRMQPIVWQSKGEEVVWS